MEQVHGGLIMTFFNGNVVIFGVDNSSSSHTDVCGNHSICRFANLRCMVKYL